MESVITEFKASLRGPLLRAEETGYEAAREVWNGMIDRRPAMMIPAAKGAKASSRRNAQEPDHRDRLLLASNGERCDQRRAAE
jgi:hypothetical protein